MNDTPLAQILAAVEAKSPRHGEKTRANLAAMSRDYLLKANDFYGKYLAYLAREGKSLDFGVDCYLHMVEDMMEERFEFMKSDHYSNTSFAEVEKKVYGNPAIMVYHMHGLVLAQFLWLEQLERFRFFSENLRSYASGIHSYLEIGGGHGLYIQEAMELLPECKRFDLVDISQSSIDLAKGILDTDKISYINKNVFDFITGEQTYDFITIGEVIEHLEDPLSLLKKLVELLGDNGVCFISTPVNSPMIDHIYLFRHESEIRELFQAAGLQILKEHIAISNGEAESRARKQKLPIMYAAFVKKA